MRVFITAGTLCFALGMVEERGRQCGLLALRPEEKIPAEVSDGGFNFGHALFGNTAFEVMPQTRTRSPRTQSLRVRAGCGWQ